MKTIREDIKNGAYRRAYLLCGTQQYLKRQYRNKLREGVLDSGDGMNCSVFEGRGIDEAEVVRLAETLPFFAGHRLIIIENSGWFKGQNSMADELRGLPDTTVFVFVEDEVDKRSRLYKAVKELGYVCELGAMEERDLKLWAASLLKAGGRKITDADMAYFLERVGTDMDNIRTETEKLIGYTCGREVVERSDIDAVCTEQISGKIFQMIDCAASGDIRRALALYHDLLVLREKPMSILFLMLRQFNILLQVRQLGADGMPGPAIAKKVGFPPFAAGKYLSQARAFTAERLRRAVEYGVETEEKVKTGQLNEQIGIELLLAQFGVK